MPARRKLILTAAIFAALAGAASRAENEASAPAADHAAPQSAQPQTSPPAAKEPAPPPSDEDMGHIVDVIVDRAGVVRAAVIDFGGFLGVGSRKIVVDWNALHFGRIANKTDSITLELSKEQVNAAPEYKEDKPIVVLGAAGNLEPFQFDH